MKTAINALARRRSPKRSLELESRGQTGDARRKNAAVDAGRIEVRRTRSVDQRVRRIRVEDVEHVDAGSQLSAAEPEVFVESHVEYVQPRPDLRAVRLDANVDGAQLRN